MRIPFFRPATTARRFFTGATSKKDRPVLFLELLFDVVVAVVIGGISDRFAQWIGVFDQGFADTISLEVAEPFRTIGIQTAGTWGLCYYGLQLLTALLIWRSMMYHMLRYDDSIHLRLTTFAVMIPFLVMGACLYVESDNEQITSTIFLLNAYCYAIVALITSGIYLFNAIANRGSLRIYNLLHGLPFLVTGVGTVVVVSAAISSYTLFERTFWDMTLGTLGAQVGLIFFGQGFAAGKRFNSVGIINPHNLKERYNSLFLIFLSELFLTTIRGWIRSDITNIENLSVLIIGIVLIFATWSKFTSYLDYLDMKQNHRAVLQFSTFMLLSICFLVVSADGMALWMRGARTVGSIAFGAATVGSLITSNSVWRCFKSYKFTTGFLVPRWAKIATASIVLTSVATTIALTATIDLLMITVAEVLALSLLYVAVNMVLFYRHTHHPLPRDVFEREIKKYQYLEEWNETYENLQEWNETG